MAEAGTALPMAVVPSTPRKVVAVSTLMSDSAGQQDFVKALQEGKDVVVLIPKGQS